MATPPTSWIGFSRRLKHGPWSEQVLRRLGEALDALVRVFRTMDGIVGLVLFGSYARGDFGRKSDVDLLVLTRRSPDRSLEEIRGAVVRAAIDAECTFHLPMHLAPVVADATTPAELGPDLLHAIWADGVVLFAEAAAIGGLQPDGLVPWAIVRFSAADLPPRQAVRLSRRLHGRGGRPGLIGQSVVELARGALLVPADQAPVIRDALDEVGATYDLVPVWREV